MSMNDRVDRLNAFLQFNEYEILKNAGNISRKIADEFAKEEYDNFRVLQDKLYRSDFDKVVDGAGSTGKLPSELLPRTLSGTFSNSIKEEIEKEQKRTKTNKSDE
jgi:hypothetical protein